MATTIVTKSGSGAPTASNLVAGELAVDLTNKRLYTENSSGTVLEVGSNPYNFTANHDGSAKLATSATGIDVTGTVTADGLTVDTDTLVVDATNNRVGIGTSSPDRLIDLRTAPSEDWQLRLGANNTDLDTYDIGRDAGDGLLHFYGNQTGYTGYVFDGINGERMRIDASGNLLLGGTNVDPAGADVAGTAIGSTGYISMSRSSGAVGIFNRKTDDGNIIELNKDGALVGSIGVDSGDNLYIGGSAASHSGLYFGTNTAAPITAGTLTDAVTDLGTAGYRFKDLYLSGGVVFGATGGAVTSKTLDDYEEGTFTLTATTSGVTISSQSCRYTKVGRLVTLTGSITFSALPSNISTMQLSGAPFNCWGEHTAGIVREVTTVGAIYVFQINANNSTFGMNSYSGVADGSARIFAINEGYNFSLTYTV
jgi:hypothetical protein